MTQRIVKVVLRGDVNSFIGSMRASSAAVKSTVSSMTDGSREADKYRQNLTSLGTSAGKLGLVAAAGVAVAVRAFANFDQAMSNVASTGDDAKRNIDALTQSAIKWGQKTQYSATEAAGAMSELLKAGVSAKDVLGGGLQGALNLAAAGQLEVADAAQIAATAMVQFGLSGKDVPHIADLLAAAANKAQGEVSDMGQALKYVGPVAHQMGVSIEETSGVIAELASNGILADQAGTSLRGMLLSLTSPSKIASTTMEQLGINVYDAQGNFVGFNGVADQLHKTMSGLTNAERDQAFGRIFGNEQITTARVLYAGGAKAVDQWTKAVDDQGYAADVAAEKMDNLKGDLEQLKGSLETALIGTGSGANGPLRETVELLTQLVNIYTEIPGPIKEAILAGAALTAVVGASAFAASRAISGYSNLKANLGEVGGAFDNVNKRALAMRGGAAAAGIALASLSGPAHSASEGLGDLTDVAAAAALGFAVGGPWGAAISGGVALFSALKGSSGEAKDQIAGLTATLDQQTGAIGQNTAAWVAKQLQDSGAAGVLTALGVSLATQTDAVLGNKAAMDQVTDATGKLGIASGAVQGKVDGLRNSVITGTKSTKDLNVATSQSIEAQKAAAGSLKDTAEAAQLTAAEQKQLDDANRKTAESFFDVSKDINNAKVSLNGWITELSKQADALNHFADNAIKAGKRGLDDGLIGSLEKAGPAGAMRLKQLADASDKEIARANRAWQKGQDAINRYIELTGHVPPGVGTTLKVKGEAEAKAAIKAIKDLLSHLPGSKTISINTVHTNTQLDAINEGRHAEGGIIRGPGTATSDSIPAYLSDGEYVMRAAAVAKYGTHMFDSLNAGHFADGGRVGIPGSNLEWAQQASKSDLKWAITTWQKALDKNTEKLSTLKDTMKSFSDTVRDNFRTDAFNQGDESKGVSGLTALKGTLATDTQNANEFAQDLKKLKAKGISDGLYNALAASGDLQTAGELASQSRSQINEVDSSYLARQRATSALGAQAGKAAYGKQVEMYASEIKGMRKDIHEFKSQLKAGAEAGTKAGIAAAAASGQHQSTNRPRG